MKRAWLLPGERMPVERPAAPRLRLERIESWIAELGYDAKVLFRERLRPSGRSGRRTGRTLLDALLVLAAAPWLALRAWFERPALILTASAMNAPIVALIKRLLGDRVTLVVDLIGMRSLESEQTTRNPALRPLFRIAWSRLERTSFNAADLVLTVNERNAELVRGVSPGAEVAVLRDAAEEELASTQPAGRRAYGIPEDAVVVGFVGSIVCARLDTLMSAWQRLQQAGGPRLHLVIVGSGPDLAHYRRRAAEGLAETVTFTGPLARDEALSVMRACDIAYTGSWSRAGFSFKLFEYLALGLPILAERKPQMTEVLTDGVDAVFYDGESELARRITEIAADAELRGRLGEAARRTFLAGHTVDRRREEFSELVGNLLTKRPLHLFEVGLSWPPETFVGWRLQALAERGVRTTVAAIVRPGESRPAAGSGLHFTEIPRWYDSAPRKLLRLIRHGLPMLVQEPGRARAVLREARRSQQPSSNGARDLLGQLHFLVPLARIKPDVVHFDWESAAVRFLPLYDIWGCPVVISCHGAGVTRHPIGPYWRDRLAPNLPIVFAKAAAVHCVADVVADHARRWGAAPESIHVIRSAVDPAFFAPDPALEASRRNGDPLRLTVVARLIPTKGHEYALSAIRLLRDAGIPVECEFLGGDPGPWVGEPSDRDRILYTIEDLELEDHVRVRGKVTSSEVRDRLRHTDVLLHPSVSDGLPTVIVEAMSCSVPVVVTDAGGARELVTDGVEGFVVRAREPAALAGAVERLWADPELRDRMGEAGRMRVREEFTMDQLANQFVEMLESTRQGDHG